MRNLLLAGAASLFLAGCMDRNVDIIPLNPIAAQIGPIMAHGDNEGFGRIGISGTVVRTGERLIGHGSAGNDMAVGIGSGTAFGSRGAVTAVGTTTVVGGGGSGSFVLYGPHTMLFCQIRLVPIAHGDGECRSADGGVWGVSF